VSSSTALKINAVTATTNFTIADILQFQSKQPVTWSFYFLSLCAIWSTFLSTADPLNLSHQN